MCLKYGSFRHTICQLEKLNINVLQSKLKQLQNASNGLHSHYFLRKCCYVIGPACVHHKESYSSENTGLLERIYCMMYIMQRTRLVLVLAQTRRCAASPESGQLVVLGRAHCWM